MPKILDLTGQKFFSLTALEKTNKRDNGCVVWKCICDCGEQVYASTNKLKRGTIKACPFCTATLYKNIYSYGEQLIAQILKNNNFLYQREYKFEDCFFKQPLRFDFAIFNKKDKKLLYLIEYDGQNHFKNSKNRELKERHQLDLIKNNYCYDNNIPLIRIPYFHKNITIKDLKIDSSNFLFTKQKEKKYYTIYSQEINTQEKIIPLLKLLRTNDKNFYKDLSQTINIKIGSLYNFLNKRYCLSEEKFLQLLKYIQNRQIF